MNGTDFTQTDLNCPWCGHYLLRSNQYGELYCSDFCGYEIEQDSKLKLNWNFEGDEITTNRILKQLLDF